MVAPIVGLAVGAAARAVAKKVASNAVKSAATKKLVKEAAKRKPLTTPKSNVKVKPAAKQVGNPRNDVKARENYYSSISRGGAGAGPAGKAKDTRVHFSKNQTADTARAAALRAEKNKALARSAKGKTQTPTAEAARRRNLNK